MNLDNQVKDSAENWGADFFGVANLSQARETILAQGGAVVAEYPRAISLGIALLHSIVNQLPQRAERAVVVSYRHHSYDVVDQRLDFIASRLSSVLQRGGYRALPIPAAKQVDDERICASFSHKLGAHLAGLGWIGKNCLLITPEVGPRVRWVTVLTDAPLSTGKPMPERCGDCVQCVEICPVNAFTGKSFREDEPREVRFNANICEINKGVQKKAEVACGLCLYACPYGKQ